MTQTTSQKPLHRILIIVSLVSFVGSTAYGFAGMFQKSVTPTPKEDTKITEVKSKDAQLQAQVKGYELVLKREPKNQVALQGLVQTQLQMNNFKGAVEPLEKLVKLNPERPDYKALLAEIKVRLSQGNTTGNH
jgi:cytochrome c-type biogenesis protein CcmH/NrfG